MWRNVDTFLAFATLMSIPISSVSAAESSARMTVSLVIQGRCAVESPTSGKPSVSCLANEPYSVVQASLDPSQALSTTRLSDHAVQPAVWVVSF